VGAIMTDSVEHTIVKEVVRIMAQYGVKDSSGLYAKVAKSIWAKESLETLYERQIAKGKRANVWGAVENSAVLLSILKDTPLYILREVQAILNLHSVSDEEGLFQRAADSIMAGGKDLITILENVASEDELGEIKPDLAKSFVIQGYLARPKEVQNTVLSEVTSILSPFSTDKEFHGLVVASITGGGKDLQDTLEQELSLEDLDLVLPSLISNLVIQGFLSKVPEPLALKHEPTVEPLAIKGEPIPEPLAIKGEPIPKPLAVKHEPAPNIVPPRLSATATSTTTTPQLSSSYPIPSNSSPSMDCIPVLCKLVLPNKLSLGEFHKVEPCALQQSSTLQMVQEIVEHYFLGDDSFSNQLHSVLFYLLKRGQELTPLTTALFDIFVDRNIDASPYSLRMLINVLLMNCNNFLRQKVINLLSSTNSIPLTEYTLKNDSISSHTFTPEPYWLLDDQFLFFSYGLDYCKGKSSLLNKTFGTTFETSNDTKFFQGTIDYQGDKMFIPSRGIAVVDGHGLISDEFKLGILKVADGVILHVSQETWKNDPVRVRNEVEMISRHVGCVVVVVRDVKEYQKVKNVNAFKSQDHIASVGIVEVMPPAFMIFLLPDLSIGDIAEFYVERLRQRVLESLWQTGAPALKIKKNKNNIYCDLLPTALQRDILEVDRGISCLYGRVEYMINESTVSDPTFMTIYPKFHKLSKLRGSILKARFDNAADKEQAMRLQMSELNDEIKSSDCSDIGITMTEFEKMITAPDNVRMMYRFVGRVKALFSEVLTDTRSELLSLKDQIQSAKGDEDLESKSSKWRELDAKLESKTISIEIFWREINQFFLLGRRNQKIFDAFTSFTLNGDPFEVIDGDNLSFPFEFLTAAFSKSTLAGKKVLVIGIIGPQNSGKSTLLNFMFGCVFTASDGRTTKGVYGSLIQSPVAAYDFLLILDTEGIHSVEKSDPEYDRKVVLFTLAVCDVVIINVKDEISDGMRKTLDICASSLRCLQNTKMPTPVLFFVQNQKANVRNIQTDAMNDIIDGMKKNGLGDIISLSQETFVALPSAFNTKDITINKDKKWRKLDTSPDFIEKVTDFTCKVFSQVKQRTARHIDQKVDIPFQDFPTWITFAHSVYVTVNKFEDLTLFANIQEKTQDETITKWLQQEINHVISPSKKEELLGNPDSITEITKYFLNKEASMRNELQDMFKQQTISTNLHSRHKNRLELILLNTRTSWTSDAQIQIENERLQTESANGQRKINDKIDSILRSGKIYTKQELVNEFKTCFDDCYSDLIKQREHKEKANKISCLSQIDTYKLFYTDLPTTVKEDLMKFIGDSSQFHMTALLQQYEVEKYRGFIYALPPVSDDAGIDPRLTDPSFKWTLFSDAIHKLSEQVRLHLQVNPNAISLGHGFFTEALSHQNIVVRAVRYVRKGLLCLFNPPPRATLAAPPRWAILMIHELHKELLASPELIIKVANVALPFEIVDELKLTDGLYQPDAVQRCVAELDKIIASCDSELRVFSFALSKTTKANMHMLMLQHLITSHLRFHSKRLQETVDNFKSQEETYRDNFLQQTSNGPEMDSASVGVMGNSMRTTLLADCLSTARKEFIVQMAAFAKTTNRALLQSTYERVLLDKSTEVEKVRYVKYPSVVLSEQFQELWNNKQAEILCEANKTYETKANLLRHLTRWVGQVLAFLNEAKIYDSRETFTAPHGSNLTDSHLAKGKAAVLLLMDLLAGKLVEPRYTAEKVVLVVQKLTCVSPKLDPVLKYIVSILLESLKSVIQISNLQVFVAKLETELRVITDLIAAERCAINILDDSNTLEGIKAKAIGCTEMCPCCKRCCDEDHSKHRSISVGQLENKHKCISGHQYRGMAGYALKKDKLASLKVCGFVKDFEKVEFEGKYYKWKDFKDKFPLWQFEVPTQVDNAIIQNQQNWMAKFWSYVGPSICKEYPAMLLAINII
jgi:energy-coupling factor transporter ATP-binding protein EcfA2